jgi:hypothetical protein
VYSQVFKWPLWENFEWTGASGAKNAPVARICPRAPHSVLRRFCAKTITTGYAFPRPFSERPYGADSLFVDCAVYLSVVHSFIPIPSLLQALTKTDELNDPYFAR